MIVESLINCLCSMLFNPFQEVSQLWIKTRDYQKLFSFEFIRTCMHAQWSAQRRADVSEFMTILAGPIVESQLLRSGDVESNPGPGRLPGRF